MPEEGLETHELREQLEEQHHHAHGHAEHGAAPSWMTALSLSTALIAAIAAVASLYAGSLANDALMLKNDAVLAQAKASDTWAFYQSKKIKEHIFDTQAEIAPADKQEKMRKDAEHERDEAKKVQGEARELERQVIERNEGSAHALHVHHLFARSVTIFQVAIALAAIAALSKKKPLWWVSLVGGAVGLFFFVQGFSAEHARGGHAEPHASAPPGASAPPPEHP